jgi:hypothetical protein
MRGGHMGTIYEAMTAAMSDIGAIAKDRNNVQ